MNSYHMSKVEEKDVMEVTLRSEIEWEKFRGKTITVTGATGLLGKSIVNVLLEANKYYGLKVKVLAFVRDIQKAEEYFRFLESAKVDGAIISDPGLIMTAREVAPSFIGYKAYRGKRIRQDDKISQCSA